MNRPADFDQTGCAWPSAPIDPADAPKQGELFVDFALRVKKANSNQWSKTSKKPKIPIYQFKSSEAESTTSRTISPLDTKAWRASEESIRGISLKRSRGHPTRLSIGNRVEN
jgi:hypothetical protein